MLGALTVLGMLAGCAQVDERLGGVLSGGEPDYKSSKRLPSLEVPPDLSTQTIQDTMQVPATGSAAWSDYDGEGAKESDASGLLLDFGKVRVERSGDERWLVVDAAPDAVWPQVKAFWLQQGFAIEVDEPGIGIMETDWAEERTKFPGGISSDASWASSPPLSPGLRSATSSVPGSNAAPRAESPRYTSLIAARRRSDHPDSCKRAKRRGCAARLAAPYRRSGARSGDAHAHDGVLRGAEGSGHADIAEVPERPARAPHRQGQQRRLGALPGRRLRPRMATHGTRAGPDRITVEDRDRSQGLYFVRYADPDRELEGEEGLLSRLAFWRDEPSPEVGDYLINLIGGDEATQVIVLDTDGERSASATADRILGLLLEQLK